MGVNTVCRTSGIERLNWPLACPHRKPQQELFHRPRVCLFNLIGTSFEPLEDIRRRTQFSPFRLLDTRLHIPAEILPSAQE